MDTLALLTELRSKAFDLAASGKVGDYPYDDNFNDVVEEGFSDNGMSWTAQDGTILFADSVTGCIETLPF